ncbi:MAG: ABC transporter permease [Gammaproteobacteria bacterium]
MNLYKKYTTAFYTILSNEVRRFIRIWSETLLPSAIMTILYFVIFGAFIGSHLAQVGGVSFMQYIAPGLIMMAIITNSYSNVVASFFILRFQRSIEELLTAPVPNVLILLGFVLGGIMRGLAVGIIVTAISLFFTHLNIYNISIIIVISLLTSALFSLAGFLNAIFAKKFDDIQIVPTFILTPLTYLGGVFYSLSQLPPVWQTISKFNPIIYIVNAFRYGILGVSDVSIQFAFVIIITANILLFFINLILLKKGIGLKT